jgi:hypothetical protein
MSNGAPPSTNIDRSGTGSGSKPDTASSSGATTGTRSLNNSRYRRRAQHRERRHNLLIAWHEHAAGTYPAACAKKVAVIPRTAVVTR